MEMKQYPQRSEASPTIQHACDTHFPNRLDQYVKCEWGFGHYGRYFNDFLSHYRAYGLVCNVLRPKDKA